MLPQKLWDFLILEHFFDTLNWNKVNIFLDFWSHEECTIIMMNLPSKFCSDSWIPNIQLVLQVFSDAIGRRPEAMIFGKFPLQKWSTWERERRRAANATKACWRVWDKKVKYASWEEVLECWKCLCASPHPKLSWRLALQKVSNIRNHTFSQQRTQQLI